MARHFTPKRQFFSGYSLLERLAFILLLLLTATAAVPRGGVGEGGALYIVVCAFVIASLALFARNGQKLGSGWLPVLLLLGIAGVGAVQLIPLENDVVKSLSPAVASVWSQANAVLTVFERPSARAHLSIAPRETARAALLICAYAALFIASVRLSRTRTQRRTVLVVFVAACVAQIAFATFTELGATTAEGEMEDPYRGRLHGTFVNANHLAGYLEIALAIVFGLIWTRSLTGSRELAADRKVALERRIISYGWMLLLWIFIAGAIALTKSRMGTAAAVVSTLLLFVLAIQHRRARRRRVAFAVAFASLAFASVFAVLAVSGNTFSRFLASDPRDGDSDVRFTLWKISLDAWRETPHLGFGLGSFRDAFRRVQNEPLGGVVEEAHNDTLQLLVTGGWISVAFAVLAIGSILFLLLRGWRRQEHREESTIALVSAGALLSLLIHGIAEFNFSIPAIPATLAIILGVGWSAAMYQHSEARSPEGF